MIKQLGGRTADSDLSSAWDSTGRVCPRDVRRVIVGDYELRYEVTENLIYILRLWHAREDR